MTPLVTTDWLADELASNPPVILDASAHLPGSGRDAHAEYRQGHIRCARFLDLPSLTNTNSPVPASIPSRKQLERRLGDLGIRPDDNIVLYDDSALRTSARAWFILRHYGMGDVAILDGGMQKWRAEGREISAEVPECAPTDLRLLDGAQGIRRKADMLANIGTGHEQVIDARDAGRFTGETEDRVHNLPGGHIPGARNLHFARLLNEDTTFRSRKEMLAAFKEAGIDPSRPIVASCGSGITASVVLFAHYLLGYDHGALYDGSWSEWGADPATPKELGA